uniref:Kinetochore protein Spc24 n=2 Tax=Hemiselmis andersenii TaxID=464988 RepID=A0A6U4W404_HEMAN|mmetsp:Transcript_32047/g.74929  ORF Transcript_32047/g.74929 Transcript_32047/m.74929 type:complete len:202 (+) Transcript_32047:92-697(+)
MAENGESTVGSYLAAVHEVFNERVVEKDLNAIKSIKKTCADTKHIVANREMEIKDVVRALQCKVEDQEERLENDQTVKECMAQLEEAEARRETLARKMDDLCKEKDASLSHIEEIQREAAQLEERRKEVEAEMEKHVPVQMGMLALYVNVTNVRFDYESSNVKGIVFPDDGAEDITPKTFDIDPASMSEFDLTNAVWDLID